MELVCFFFPNFYQLIKQKVYFFIYNRKFIFLSLKHRRKNSINTLKYPYLAKLNIVFISLCDISPICMLIIAVTCRFHVPPGRLIDATPGRLDLPPCPQLFPSLFSKNIGSSIMGNDQIFPISHLVA